jgi:ATP-dependent Clp protease ATP-binding subunit ClpC
MARLDMSEFQTADANVKILGQRGEITNDSLIERIRRQPFSVVLLDEFEKAHTNTWDLFLQIFDDGRLSDANGREADFRHCFIILTSNLGAAMRRGPGPGFRPGAENNIEGQVMQTVAQTFRPEFINRLDKIIVFRPLSRELMRNVLHKELARVLERRGLRERAWAVEWEASAIELLLDRGFSREMGARPLRRAIDQLLLAPLAATLVEHRFPQGDQFLFVRANGQTIEVEFVDPDGRQEESSEFETDADAGLSLPAIMLRQTGSAQERASLTANWREICDTLAGEAWSAASNDLQRAMGDPDFWSDETRFRTLSVIEMTDRVREAARTADRLFQRYTASSEHRDRASRELAARVALQLFNIRQGLDDIAVRAPVDALLVVEPSMEAGGDTLAASGWCARLVGMYRHWAVRRRVQISDIKDDAGRAPTILHFTGFGAFRTLQAEAGLHVLEEQMADTTRRLVARVTVVAGPDQYLPSAGRFVAVTKLMADVPGRPAIVRRYREEPAPIVRDAVRGWRTGRLDAVLGGDFDLMGAA